MKSFLQSNKKIPIGLSKTQEKALIPIQTNTLLRLLGSLDDPRDIQGLNLWLDASDPNTLYTGAIGGSLVGSSQLVGRWEDKSGLGRYVGQATSTLRPTRITNAYNGLDTVRFTSDYLLGNGFQFDISERSVFVVVKENSNVNFSGIVSFTPVSGSDSSANDAYSINFGDTTLLIYVEANGYYISEAGGGLLPLSVVSDIFGDGTGYLRRDGNQIGSASKNNFTKSSGNYGIGTRTNSSGTSFSMRADLCEVLVYSRKLPLEEVLIVEEYLANKWGISLSS